MAQFKIYGNQHFLGSRSTSISNAIHAASMAALGLPGDKRFHRFLPLEPWQLISPGDRSEKYIIIEIMMFEGRSVETKKAFYEAVLANLDSMCGIDAMDVEIVITESPRHNWLIRGDPGDELTLNYQIEPRADDRS